MISMDPKTLFADAHKTMLDYIQTLEDRVTSQGQTVAAMQENIRLLHAQLIEAGMIPATVSVDSHSSGRAIQAASVMQWGNLEDRQRYLRLRGWTQGASSWWTNKAIGYDQLLFEKAMEVQVKHDLKPFMFMLDTIKIAPIPA